MAFVTKLAPSLRHFSTSSGKQALIKEFVVIGGGLMGAGIAQVGAQTGHKVTMVDLSQEVLDKSQVKTKVWVKKGPTFLCPGAKTTSFRAKLKFKGCY